MHFRNIRPTIRVYARQNINGSLEHILHNSFRVTFLEGHHLQYTVFTVFPEVLPHLDGIGAG